MERKVEAKKQLMSVEDLSVSAAALLLSHCKVEDSEILSTTALAM